MPVTPEDLARTLRERAARRRRADEHDRDVCIAAVVETVRALRAQMTFGRLWVIGSLVKGDFGVRSDVDVVVEGASLDVLRMIADALGEATKRTVDALAFEGIPSSFRERVLREGHLVT